MRPLLLDLFCGAGGAAMGSRWLWWPHANAYLGFDNTPEPCAVVAYSTHSHSATRNAGPIGPYDYVVKVDSGLKFYAFDSGLAPLSEVLANA